ncbi:1330_t:CDS:2 [Acaulospora colombiana]|uniref:1330_t:CDS:1 n=1 Tax=Acaulospora colombiana TaxID=27376 RepID=A0ACA9KFT7_9GLOM|nr:1330_t:CDS:2 [Acaulospora colombiana]
MDFQLYLGQPEKKWASNLTGTYLDENGDGGMSGKDLSEISNQCIEIFDDDTEEERANVGMYTGWEEDFGNHFLKQHRTHENSFIDIEGNSQSSSLIFEDIIIDDPHNDYVPLSTPNPSKSILTFTTSNDKSEKSKVNNDKRVAIRALAELKVHHSVNGRPILARISKVRIINLLVDDSIVIERKRKFEEHSTVVEKKVRLTGDSTVIEKKAKPARDSTVTERKVNHSRDSIATEKKVRVAENSTETERKVKVDENSSMNEKKPRTKRNYGNSSSGRSPWTKGEENKLMEAVEVHGAKWSLGPLGSYEEAMLKLGDLKRGLVKQQ